MNLLIITNNYRAYTEIIDKGDSAFRGVRVDYHEDASQDEILIMARDMIYLGARLVMHPMAGRIKPHETPYKSVFLEVPDERERERGISSDFMSITIIEDSIQETKKFLTNTYMKKYDDSLLPDLQFIDYLLLKSGAEEYR